MGSSSQAYLAIHCLWPKTSKTEYVGELLTTSFHGRIMADALRNSIMPSNEFAFQDISNCQVSDQTNFCRLHVCYSSFRRSVIRSNRNCATCVSGSMSGKGSSQSQILKPRTLGISHPYSLTMKTSDLSAIARVVFCRPEASSAQLEETALTRSGNEEFESEFFEHKFPPQGKVSNLQDLDSEHEGERQLSVSTNEPLLTHSIGLHYLEERNENVLSKRLLTLSRSNKVRSALELYRSMDFFGLHPDVHACNSLLSCLLRRNMFQYAFKVFELMKKNETASSHSYSLILKATSNAYGYNAAAELFAKLEADCRNKNDFDVILYNAMISICGRVNDWVETKRLWNCIKENGHMGTQVTYRLLVSIFVRSGRNDLACDAYREMIHNGLEPTEDAMQAITRVFAKEGKWDLALGIFRNMLQNELKPSLVTCNALINSLEKAGKGRLAMEVYEHMKLLSHSPDAYTWNTLLGSLYRLDQHVDALQLFEHIKKNWSSHSNVHLYNTVLMSCQKLGLWDRAVQLLWEMESSGLSVPTATYNLVIGVCEVAKKPEIALQIYEHMVYQKRVPNTFTHLSLIRSCIGGSLWREVEQLLEQVEPNACLYNAGIQGMCLCGNVESAMKLYTMMFASGLQPDGKTRALILQRLTKANKRKAKLVS